MCFLEEGEECVVRKYYHRTPEGVPVKVTYEYDDKGNLIKKKQFNDSGDPLGKRVYKYDKLGNLIEEKDFFYAHAEKGKYVCTFFKSYTGLYEKDWVYKREEGSSCLDETLNLRETYKYNGDGNMIELIRLKHHYHLMDKIGLDSLGTCTINKEISKFKYDGKGNLIEEYSKGIDNKNSIQVICKYDNRGNRIKEIWKMNGIFHAKNIYKYGKNGHIIEDQSFLKYKATEKKEQKRIYKYDNKGNLIKTIKYSPDDCVFHEITYNYDGKGNKIEETHYDGSGNTCVIKTYKYDENRNRTEKSWFGYRRCQIKRWICKYNGNGNITEKNWYAFGDRLDLRITHKYNNRAKKVESRYHYSEDVLSTNPETKDFFYDEKGMWTTIIKFNDDIAKYTILYQLFVDNTEVFRINN